MNKNYIEKLEYNIILQKLSTYCETENAKNLCKNLLPYKDIKTVQNKLEETNEAVNLLFRCGMPPILDIGNNTDTIKILKTYGTLSAQKLFKLANILNTSLNLKEYFYVEHISIEDFPILDNYFSKLYTNKTLTEKIFKSIQEDFTISDEASSTLKSIRKNKLNTIQEIKNKLNNIVHSSNNSKYLQENVITIRNERYVIPVKEEYRSQIKGFIHDISSSGATVFIEPISIFELNNKLNNLKIEEHLEIEKILEELSKLFYPYVDNLILDIDLIEKLDFIFAKAKYSKAIKATMPKINNEKFIFLKNAKHPLLEKDKAVPITITLGKDYKILLITGPNTGGKTVTLKTVGLLTCMACSGLNIPADNTSSIYVFDNIFADIGDNQSIMDSLSTFSSHMLNIIEIMKNHTQNSLVLLDELCSGTDPIEGAALATSILDYFKNSNTLTIATTHYQELKKYALTQKDFENASVEFDLNTLSPTYKLLIGIPGKSNAFEISKKLGLENKIIENAKKYITNEDIDFEELLKNIYDNKVQLEKEKEEITEKLLKINIMQNKLENDNNKLLEEKQNIIKNAKIEARTILLTAKEEANDLIKKLHDNSNTKDLNNIRNKINSNIKDLSQDIKNHANNLDHPNQSNLTINDIIINNEYFINSLNQTGTVLKLLPKSNEVQMQIGLIKTIIPIIDLQKVTNKNVSTNNKTTIHTSGLSKSKTATTEINIIGKNVDEAEFIIDKFIDDALLANLPAIHIIHGKGTGKLREGIHKFLKNDSRIKSFRLGTYSEGADGVTIAYLN